MSPATVHDALARDGFAVICGIISTEDARSVCTYIERLLHAETPTSRQVLYTHQLPAEPRPALDRLLTQWLNPHRTSEGCTSGPLERVGRRLAALGFDLRPFQDVLLMKTPAHAPLPWHQDEPFWPFDEADGLVVWCALDPVDRTNGGVEVAINSHRLGRGPAIDLHTGEPQAGHATPLPECSTFEVVCPVLGPGDALLFRPRTWHRSGRNESGALRRGWSTSWIPPRADLRPDLAPRHPLARIRQQP